jgi:hypothetical protein
MFRPPFKSRRPVLTGERPEREAGKSSTPPPAIFFGFPKEVDGRCVGVFAEPFPLVGKLFEIYFVRLIGTPNQVSKYDAGTDPLAGRNRHRVQ